MFGPHKTRAALVEEAVEYLQDYPTLPNAALVEALQTAGFEPETATEMVGFIPLAFFRVLLETHGTRFPDVCLLQDAYGVLQEEPLSRQLTFQAGLESARAHYANHMAGPHIEAIIFRSAEFAQVNELLTAGEKLDAIEVEPALVDALSQDPPGTVPPQEEELDDEEPTPGAWWQFWK